MIFRHDRTGFAPAPDRPARPIASARGAAFAPPFFMRAARIRVSPNPPVALAGRAR